MDDNIIPINPKDAVKKRIGEALQHYEKRSDQWIDAMLELAAALAEGRACSPPMKTSAHGSAPMRSMA